MDSLKKHLPASTLIETIVASVIFMVLFLIGLSTLTGVSLHTGDPLSYIVADHTVKKLYLDYASGALENNYEAEYPWGTVRATVVPYGSHTGLTELSIRAIVNPGSKVIECKYLIENEK